MSTLQEGGAARQRAAINAVPGADETTTSRYLDHMRSTRRIIQEVIAAREAELANTAARRRDQEQDLTFPGDELARLDGEGGRRPVAALAANANGSAISALQDEISSLEGLSTHELKIAWRQLYGGEPPRSMSRDLMIRALAYRMQERIHGGLSPATRRKLRSLAAELETKGADVFDPGITLKPGARLVREWAGRIHTVIVLENGFDYEGERYPSLTKIAARITGAHWSGPRFFGIARRSTRPAAVAEAAE